MGSTSFVEDLQALAHGRLNLSAWHGFQEVFYRDNLDIKQVTFDFCVQDAGYFTFFFNRENDISTGIRLSANQMFPSAWLRVQGNGRFIQKKPFDMLLPKGGRWSQLCLLVDGADLRFTIDGVPLPFAMGIPLAPNALGFRGCSREVLIDNVKVVQRSERPCITEDFSNKACRPLVAFVCFGVLILINLGLFPPLRIAGLKPLDRDLAIVAFNLSILLASLGLLYFVSFYRAERYPRVTALRRKESQWNSAEVQRACVEIQDRYRIPPDPSIYRVLFLGSSQTFGSGALRNGDSITQVVEHRLNDNAADSIRFECINGGIRGTESGTLLALLRDQWIHLQPQLVIVNLSNNDAATETRAQAFPHNLRRLARICRECGAELVFVLEANAIEVNAGDLALHPVMRRIGNEEHVPIVEMHNYLKAHYDDGFLWWDWVHATSFGQQLMADCILEALVKMDIPVTAKP